MADMIFISIVNNRMVAANKSEDGAKTELVQMIGSAVNEIVNGAYVGGESRQTVAIRTFHVPLGK